MSYRYSEAERENVLKEGEEIGIGKGIEEGKEEERGRVVLNMQKEGLTLQQISLYTKLPMEDIEYIKQGGI